MKCNKSLRRPLPSLLQLSRLAIGQCLAWWLSAASTPSTNANKNSLAPVEISSGQGLPPLFSKGAFTLLDGTCGNGHDTLFLAETASPFLQNHPQAQVNLLAFDIQATAVNNTRQRIQGQAFPQNLILSYFNEGHEQAARHCPPNAPLILAVYNLGFLPGSDKTVITTPENSLASFQGLLSLMPPRGMFVIHAYGGHEGGFEEVEAVRHWAASLPENQWTARCYETITPVKNPESLFVIEKIDDI